MPELPEIETIKRNLSARLKNKAVTSVTVRDVKLRQPLNRNLAKVLVKQHLLKIERRGKYLLCYFKSGCLLIHLGMSGVLSIVKKVTVFDKHDHVEICFGNDHCLRFNDPRRFGCVVWITGDPLAHKLLHDLGVEPLSKDFNAAYLFAKTRHKKIAIKSLLMNNKILVGVGNIYSNEALFRAKIHPLIRAGALTKQQCASLVNKIKAVLRLAIKYGGTSVRDFRNAHGKMGQFQKKLLVYGRAGQPCKACGTTIHGQKLGQRGTFFCPKCQKK